MLIELQLNKSNDNQILNFAVADVLLWKDKVVSAAILVGIGALWYLFEVIGYNFLTLLCHTIIFAMVIIFVWDKVADIFKW